MTDKDKHFIVGFIIAIMTYWFGIHYALGLTALAAVGKEWFDKVTGVGAYELEDIYATLAGGFAGIMIALLLAYIYLLYKTI